MHSVVKSYFSEKNAQWSDNNPWFDWAYVREFKFQRSYPISKTSDNSRVGGRGRAKAGNFAALTSFTFLFFFRHRVEVYSLYGRALWSPYARSLWKIAAHFAIWRPVGLPWCNMDVNGMGSEVIKNCSIGYQRWQSRNTFTLHMSSVKVAVRVRPFASRENNRRCRCIIGMHGATTSECRLS